MTSGLLLFWLIDGCNSGNSQITALNSSCLKTMKLFAEFERNFIRSFGVDEVSQLQNFNDFRLRYRIGWMRYFV